MPFTRQMRFSDDDYKSYPAKIFNNRRNNSDLIIKWNLTDMGLVLTFIRTILVTMCFHPA
jgi:hypothetical protein